MTEFDPNNPGKSVSRKGKNWTFDWATYVPNRRPQFKVHATQGHAKSACTDKKRYSKSGYRIPDEVKLYQLKDGLWVLVDIHRDLPLGYKKIDIITGEVRS